MDRLPFVDLPDPVVPPVDSLDLCPYTEPTWARSSPRHRSASVSWPPAEPALLADRLLDELVADLVVDERITKAVSKWLERAERRIAGAVRPHLGDVHVARCGSFASRTHLSTGWDVDIAVRLLAEAPRARRSDSDPLTDLARWLTRDLEVPITPGTDSVAIEAPGGVVVRVLPVWGVYGSGGEREGSYRCPVDPLAHTQLVCARSAHLGNDGCFSRLIRVVKHLTRRGHEPDQDPALSSFAVETLALNIFTTPFCLAEGLTHFLRTCAELITAPFTHPFAPDAPITLPDAQRVIERLSYAADICEGALFAVEPAGLRDLGRLLRGPVDPGASPPKTRRSIMGGR